jgi:hypothetical protein
VRFDSDTVYVLATNLDIGPGRKLVIEPGTLIRMRNRLSITIRPGAAIEADGTVDNPIVITSDAAPGSAGIQGSDGSAANFWYGLRIYGNYATDSTRSSGSISFLRVEFAGGDENFAGLPSLLFQDVTASTRISHIQVSYSMQADAFSFRGGNCQASELVSYASGVNDFSFFDGYAGKLQHILAYRHPFFPVFRPGPNLAGFFISGSGTAPVISNATVLGPENAVGTSLTYAQRVPSAALLVNAAARFRIRNSVLMGFPKAAFYMNDRNSAIALQSGLSEFTHNMSQSYDSTLVFTLPSGILPPFSSADFKLFLLNPSFYNQAYVDDEVFAWINPYAYDAGPDPNPGSQSPVLTGADFSGPDFSHPFFRPVAYRGALGDNNWLSGWTNFLPLQTVYNRKS